MFSTWISAGAGDPAGVGRAVGVPGAPQAAADTTAAPTANHPGLINPACPRRTITRHHRGRAILEACEAAAKEKGFQTLAPRRRDHRLSGYGETDRLTSRSSPPTAKKRGLQLKEAS